MTSTEVISKIIEAGVNDDLKEAERLLEEYATDCGCFGIWAFCEHLAGNDIGAVKIGGVSPSFYELFLNHQKEQP